MREPKQPNCVDCGQELACRECNDTRPTAGDLYAGWRILSPFDRWETIVKVEHPDRYGPVRVWTSELGEQIPWTFPAWRKMTAREPDTRMHGEPEIRVVEYDYARDAPMYAVATASTNRGDIITGDGVLVRATYTRGEGWTVHHHWPDRGGPPEATRRGSKAAARTEVRRIAREYAKKMGGVKVTLPDARK